MPLAGKFGVLSLKRARTIGKISGVLLILALFGLTDTLQTIARTPFNQISLIPGESAPITGVLPHNVTLAEEDLSGGASEKESTLAMPGGLSLHSADGKLSFEFRDVYKGSWMGGTMWRGALVADKDAGRQEGMFTVIDMLPDSTDEKANSQQPENSGRYQNPELVYHLVVFANEAERKAASPSLCLRYLGIPGYYIAISAMVSGLLLAVLSFVYFRKAEVLLGQSGFSIIYGARKNSEGRYFALFTLADGITPFDLLKKSKLHPERQKESACLHHVPEAKKENSNMPGTSASESSGASAEQIEEATQPANHGTGAQEGTPVQGLSSSHGLLHTADGPLYQSVSLYMPDGSFCSKGEISKIDAAGKAEAFFPMIRPRYGWIVGYSKEE